MPFVRWFSPLGAVLALASAAAAQVAAAPDLSTVRHLDLARYLGRWYEIARLPDLLEHGMVASSDTCTQLPDGTLRAVFRFRRHDVDALEQQWSRPAWIADPGINAVWKVRLFWPYWPFASSFRVLELDPNYGWSVVANDNGSRYWILARAPRLDRDTYREIMERLRRRRLVTGPLELVPQAPAGEPSGPSS